eukprot:4634127-Prymnesium_polylepis.1
MFLPRFFFFFVAKCFCELKGATACQPRVASRVCRRRLCAAACQPSLYTPSAHPLSRSMRPHMLWVLFAPVVVGHGRLTTPTPRPPLWGSNTGGHTDEYATYRSYPSLGLEPRSFARAS